MINIQKIKLILFSMVFILLFSLFGWSSVADPAYFNEEYLDTELVLNADQKNQVKKIFMMLDKQKINDRKLYKENMNALYRFALQRRKMLDKFVEKSLDTEQKRSFNNLKWKRNLQTEFFIINETLFPDKDQSYRIKSILDEYKKKKIAIIELRKSMRSGKSSGKRGGSGMRGGGMGSGGQRGEGMRGGGQRGGGMGNRSKRSEENSPFNSLNNEKYKKIEKLLTEPQKKWLEEVKTILNNEQKIKRPNRVNKI